jgi:hypothetical protein
MPNVNVTERKVTPKLDYGLVTGLIAGLFIMAWMLTIGAIGQGSATDHGVFTSSIVLGSKVFSESGFGADWIIGEIVNLVTWMLIGVVFALAWPKIRKYGVWGPSLIFMIVAYFVVVQIIGRIISPQLPSELGFAGLFIGFVISGFIFAFRYRSV